MEEQGTPQPPATSGRRYYKAVKHDGSSFYGDFKYDLPKGGEPGAWTPMIPELEQCRKGYHFTSLTGLRYNFSKGDESSRVFEIEYRGEIAADKQGDSDAKMCAQSIRLVREIAYHDAIRRGILKDTSSIREEARKLVYAQQQSGNPELATEAAVVAEGIARKIEDEIRALPVTPAPIMALETFAKKHRMKLSVQMVFSERRTYDIPGARDGNILVSISAKVKDRGHDQWTRAAAYGRTVDDAMSFLCETLTNKTLKVNGVVTEHGEPFSVKAPILLPQSEVDNQEARDAAAKVVEPAKPKAKAPARKPAKKSGRKSR